jgi:hypothetical protein
MLELASLLLVSSAVQATDPLAPAKRGEIQCVNPNKEKKTCFGMATYTVRADGSYDSSSTMIIAPQPLITMEVKQSGKVEGAKMCGPIRKADFEAASFQMDGNPVDEGTANMIRTQVSAALAAMDGKTGCSTARADGDMLALDVTVDGAPRPEMSQKAIWVKPSDGYKLGM